jgi:phenylpyruvate tautomerase PptA (4-oxalocrotonate tautomerase family)
MFKDRLSAKDVAEVLSRFQQKPDDYGWVVVTDDGDIAVEMGEGGYEAMPPQMVKASSRALGIRFGKPKTRLSVMFNEVDDGQSGHEWQSVLQIARAFKERWPVVIYDHASTVYDNLN